MYIFLNRIMTGNAIEKKENQNQNHFSEIKDKNQTYCEIARDCC